MSEQVSNARILDLLAQAVKGDVHWVFHRGMSAAERSAFDFFLVRMKDPLAWQAGTTESRFLARVARMKEQAAEAARKGV